MHGEYVVVAIVEKFRNSTGQECHIGDPRQQELASGFVTLRWFRGKDESRRDWVSASNLAGVEDSADDGIEKEEEKSELTNGLVPYASMPCLTCWRWQQLLVTVALEKAEYSYVTMRWNAVELKQRRSGGRRQAGQQAANADDL